ncbi:hypothetical protein RJ55_06981 [Drechmeria coniospora]|nr:hypothetical protein RJ55_06981 [Drechmeria coniospora]
MNCTCLCRACNMRLICSLFATFLVQASCAEQSREKDSSACPSFDNAAAFAEYRAAINETGTLEKLRKCVPGHGIIPPFQNVIDPTAAANEDYGTCPSTVSTWACTHGFDCSYRQNCIRRIECPDSRINENCSMNPCSAHSKELNCTIASKVPPGIEHKFDHLSIRVDMEATRL